MQAYLAEFIGTAILVLLGNGVVANVVLAKTKGNAAGWIVIAFGWGMAVFVGGVVRRGDQRGAHLNPAVTLGLAAAGNFAWAGCRFCTSWQCWADFRAGTRVLVLSAALQPTNDADAKLATFCTGAGDPARRCRNLVSELIGTLVLVLAVLLAVEAVVDRAGPNMTPTRRPGKIGLGTLGGFAGGIAGPGDRLVAGRHDGLRDQPGPRFGPRIAHALLPVPGKRDSDWGYAWIPVVGPLLGACLRWGSPRCLPVEPDRTVDASLTYRHPPRRLPPTDTLQRSRFIYESLKLHRCLPTRLPGLHLLCSGDLRHDLPPGARAGHRSRSAGDARGGARVAEDAWARSCRRRRPSISTARNGPIGSSCRWTASA